MLRFVDPKRFEIREEFLRFLHCSDGLSGKGLFETLTKSLRDDLKLDLSDCRGQAYDGAGAVAGTNVGLASLITARNSLALYVLVTNLI